MNVISFGQSAEVVETCCACQAARPDVYRPAHSLCESAALSVAPLRFSNVQTSSMMPEWAHVSDAVISVSQSELPFQNAKAASDGSDRMTKAMV